MNTGPKTGDGKSDTGKEKHENETLLSQFVSFAVHGANGARHSADTGEKGS
jgi:hypothetical protein